MVSELLPCPFCGQQDFLIDRLDSDASVVICQGLTGPHEACLARGPVGVAQHEGEEQPGRDKAVELWNASAQQHQGEPVAWMYTRPEVEWPAFYDKRKDAAGWKETPLYTRADPGEVERLRKERQRMDVALVAAANERDTLRVQLAERDALLEEAWTHDISTPLKRRIKTALSASAEPKVKS
ncbi:Lar family restriction alleviation protein [Pseudomonas sp. NY11955]|uniref:Lar family restriction alleviation protein n=1 Tax=Pseudomonas sp. NY11955 TaxID=3400363 RepID=UPI003A83FF10